MSIMVLGANHKMITINSLPGQTITIDDEGLVTITEAIDAKKKKKKKSYWNKEEQETKLDVLDK